jgi:hypothetical protein
VSLSKAWLALAIGILGVATPAFCQSAPAKILLGSAEIKQSLTGKLISYSPPGWADAGAHEEFHKDGSWGGLRYSRGPDKFSGRWSVEANQLCVVADKGSSVEKQHPGKYCRQVWKNTSTGQLLIAHISGFDELQALSVQDLKRWGMQ